MAPIVRAPPNRVGGLHGIPPKAQRRPRKSKQAGTAPTPNCCENPDPQEEDGIKICKNCFTELSNVNITAEVTFEDQAGGRSTVQGGLVGENARFSKTLGAGAYRRIGGGERNSMVEIENAGRRALASLAAPLKIPDNITQQAASVWSLAALNNFMAGRRTDEVAAACMWAACRRQKENDVLLMDMAEILRINVFRLGEVYKDLCEKLYLEGKPVGYQHFVEMEPLIKKYCQKLQFGDKTNQVGHDALRIMRRMNRDWIVSGRHPAGLCGACIILAARMNNFQRSVREIVYVSKVADATVAKRVEEFRRTKSAGLTVEQFREYGNRIVHQHDPPAIYESARQKQRLELIRARREAHHRQSQERQSVITVASDESDLSSRDPSVALATPPPTQQPASYVAPPAQMTIRESSVDKEGPSRKRASPEPSQADGENEGRGSPKRVRIATPPASGNTTEQVMGLDGTNDQNESQAESTQSSAGATASETVRLDADGFAIPALPIDPLLLSNPDTDDLPIKRKRGRPKKGSEPPPVEISQEELADEDYLEEQINKMLEDGQIEDAQNEVIDLKEKERIEAEAERAKLTAAEQQRLDNEKIQQRREAEGFVFGETPTGEILTAAELEEEFKDDIEVENCLLSPAEIKIKERIWVTHNEDWLRKQAEKEMLQLVAKATGLPGRKGRKAKKKRGKMGDRSVLAEAETPIESPADAAKAMLDKRAPQKSQHVDFSALQRIYGRTSQTPSREMTSGPESPAEGATTPNPDDENDRDDAAAQENGDGEGDEERDGQRRQQEDQSTWNDGQDDEEYNEEADEEDEDEADWRTALAIGTVDQVDRDEFGELSGGGSDDGYEEYE